MDKAEKITKQRLEAEAWLAGEPDFVATSVHPSWQGKVKCRYCKSAGWPWKPGFPGNWWGRNHGKYCKWKELWELKQRANRPPITTINYSYATNANLAQWQNTYASTYYLTRI